MNIINAKWNGVDSYEVSVGGLASKSTVGFRALGEGKFYFEIQNLAGTTNRWIGVTSRVDPPWVSYGEMPETSRTIAQTLVIGAVYGIHLDLRSTTKGKARWNMNGGVFSDWVDLVDYANKPLLSVRAATGTNASANNATAFKMNGGQEPFITPEEIFANDTEFNDTYTFDGAKKISGLGKMLYRSEGNIYAVRPLDIIHHTKMTADNAPAPFVATASNVYSSTYIASKAFNGTNKDATDCWISRDGTKTGHIQIDYGEKRIVNVLYLTGRFTPVGTDQVKDFEIMGSNDGQTFVSLATILNQTNWPINKSETRKFVFENYNEYRIYRINILSNNGYSYVAIGEILFAYEGIELIKVLDTKASTFLNYGESIIKKFDNRDNKMKFIIPDSNEIHLNEKPIRMKFE